MHAELFSLAGLIVGALARLTIPGPDSGGLLASMLVGVAGSLAGGYLGRFLGLYGNGRPGGFLMALTGAVGLLVAYRMYGSRRGSA